jgi:hypothetical protein
VEGTVANKGSGKKKQETTRRGRSGKRALEKKAARKKAARKKTGRSSVKAPTLKRAHAIMSSLFSETPRRAVERAALAEAVTAAAAAAEKSVSFTLTNIGSIGKITSGVISFAFSGGSKVGHLFPVGVNDLFYGVQGPPDQAFAINV